MKAQIKYRVHAEGFGLKTEDIFFKTKKEALAYMAKWFNFYKEMEADIFTCIKEIEDDSIWVKTKYYICNI